MIYLKLFLSFLQVGLFSIGGGYAALPLIQNQIVDLHGFITLGEFADIITIAEMTPGPIAINAATFVGMQTAGVAGAAVSTLGFVFPSFVIVLTLAFVYYKYRSLFIIQGILKGLRPAVVALIASAGISILLLAFFGAGNSFDMENLNTVSVFIFLLAIFILRKFKLSPVYIILGSGVLGLVIYSFLNG